MFGTFVVVFVVVFWLCAHRPRTLICMRGCEDHLLHFNGENDSDHRSLTYALVLFSMIARWPVAVFIASFSLLLFFLLFHLSFAVCVAMY